MNTFRSWNTTKTAAGYRWAVYSNVSRTTPNAEGRYVDSSLFAEGICRTRAQAVGAAKRAHQL